MLKNSNAQSISTESFSETGMEGIVSAQRPAASVSKLHLHIDHDMAETIILRLRGRFIETAGMLAKDLDSAIDMLEMIPVSGLRQIHGIAHTLAGNAATFGFPMLGRTAAILSELSRGHAETEADFRDVHELASSLLLMLQVLPVNDQ